MVNEIKAVIEKHKDHIPVVVTAELLTVLDGMENYCVLLDKLIKETPQYIHGICAFRDSEECVDFECCENCFVDAVKDLIKNSDSRFRKISEVE